MKKPIAQRRKHPRVLSLVVLIALGCGSRAAGKSVLIFFMICSVWWWASHARADCANDTECKGDRICVDGVCTSSETACKSDIQCDGAQVCDAGVCVEADQDPPPKRSKRRPRPSAPDQDHVPLQVVDGGHFVSYQSFEGQTAACQSPCTLQVRRGSATLVVDKREAQNVNLAGPSQLRLRGSGGALLGIGIAVSAVGAGMIIGGSLLIEDVESYYPYIEADNTGAYALIGGGVGAALVGTIMAAIDISRMTAPKLEVVPLQVSGNGAGLATRVRF
jgi:hypothetical protein